MDGNRKKEMEQLIRIQKNLDKCLENLPKKDNEFRTQERMQLLHRYNDVKDATQIMVGALANLENNTVAKMHDKLQLPLD